MGRSGLGMTSLFDGVGLGRGDGGDIGDSGGNCAMVVSEEVCGGTVVAESVPAIVGRTRSRGKSGLIQTLPNQVGKPWLWGSCPKALHRQDLHNKGQV